jgi:hypothetical protein
MLVDAIENQSNFVDAILCSIDEELDWARSVMKSVDATPLMARSARLLLQLHPYKSESQSGIVNPRIRLRRTREDSGEHSRL